MILLLPTEPTLSYVAAGTQSKIALNRLAALVNLTRAEDLTPVA